MISSNMIIIIFMLTISLERSLSSIIIINANTFNWHVRNMLRTLKIKQKIDLQHQIIPLNVKAFNCVYCTIKCQKIAEQVLEQLNTTRTLQPCEEILLKCHLLNSLLTNEHCHSGIFLSSIKKTAPSHSIHKSRNP